MPHLLRQLLPSKQLLSTISSKGQVTIPVKIRRHLGVDSNDKVAFVVESNGDVKITQPQYPDINSLKGAAGKLPRPLAWKEVKRVAQEDRFKAKYGA
ncbi:MAG: type II toxin-antitoxin system PrlF family antitoxin [bacterium]|nr:type II toxin-antitoxin system PrlF family antitoxin [bacterium]